MNYEHFIPFSKNELIDYLTDKYSSKKEKKSFMEFCRLIESTYHMRFQKNLEDLKNSYLPIDPDRNVELIKKHSHENLIEMEKKSIIEIEKILIAGNYVKISKDKLQNAFKKKSPWGLNLKVDLNNYEYVSLYYRGEYMDSLDKKKFIFKKHYDFLVYQRVVLLFKLKDEVKYSKDYSNKFKKNMLYFKLFKNVPSVDLEMLFPDIKIKILPFDQAKVMIPLTIGSITTIYKTISYIHSDGNPQHLWVQIGFWILIVSLFLIASQGFADYKNTIEKYLRNLTTSLYFQNLDNNSGVFKYLLDDAEEEECKELILAYFFLLNEKGQKHNEKSLDERIEFFFLEEFGKLVDFEVDDALRKLKEICLFEAENDLQVISIERALNLLNKMKK